MAAHLPGARSGRRGDGGPVESLLVGKDLTGANGDQLYTNFSGEFDLLTGTVSVTITYVGGSGRFAGASGTAELSGELFDDGSFHVVVQGTLDF